MARKRMIDPMIWESEQVMGLTSEAFKVYIYTIGHADDEGRMVVSIPMIRSRCFPMNLEEIDEDLVAAIVEKLGDIGLVELYTDDSGRQLLCHPNWLRYQTINRPQPSKLPSIGDCKSNHGAISDDSVSGDGALTPKLSKDKLIKVNTREGSVSGHGLLDDLEKSAWKAFEHGYANIMPDRDKQLDAIHKLTKLAGDRGDPAIIIPAMMAKLKELKDGDEKFWKKQPFLPATLVSLWARIWEEAKIEAEEVMESEEVEPVDF